MRDDGGEWDAPVFDVLRQPAGDWDAIVEILSPLLGRPLLYMSGDAIHREDLAPHIIFTACIGH